MDDYEGFYLVSGQVHTCRYPVLLKNAHSLEYANGERISEAPVASYELREAIRSEELKVESAEGYVWKPSNHAENPFRDYVQDFYSRKNNTSRDHPLFVTYKLLLNTLYGKTFQASGRPTMKRSRS